MSFAHPAVVVRRLIARRPFVYWSLVAVVALGAAASVHAEIDTARRVRSQWETTVPVLVAADDHQAGEPLRTSVVEAPMALVPDTALGTEAEVETAWRDIAAGSIVTELDVGRRDGDLALVPDGWRALAIVETPRTPTSAGDRVEVVSDGVVVAPDAIVVSSDELVTVLAAPADAARLVALAAANASVALLRVP